MHSLNSRNKRDKISVGANPYLELHLELWVMEVFHWRIFQAL